MDRQRMAVGLFCDTYPPQVDGVGMVVQNYAKELVRLKYSCFVVSPHKPDYKMEESDYEQLQFKGISFRWLPQYRAGIPSLDFSYLRQIKHLKMDILHVHSPFGSGFEAMRLARRQKIPLIGTFHTRYYEDFFKVTRSKFLSSIGVKIILRFYNACDEVWVPNDDTAELLHDYGYKRCITVIPNGTTPWVASEKGQMQARQHFQLGKGPILLYVGQQNWKKNIRHMIEALALYKTEQPEFQMVMVGAGPDQEAIQALAKALGLSDNIQFTGQLMNREMLMELYACATLFLFPSVYDTAGLVVSEAAMVGTPSLVVEGSSAAGNILDGENGFLCIDDPKDIACKLGLAVGDMALLHRVGERAKKSIPVPWETVGLWVDGRYRALMEAYA